MKWAGPKCGSCRFYVAESDAQGFCYHAPPAITSVVNNQIASHRPPVSADTGCGQHQARAIRQTLREQRKRAA